MSPMILAKPEILRQIRKGRIRIEPYDEGAVGPASIDLTLDDKLRVFKAGDHITDADTDYRTITDLVDITMAKIAHPGRKVRITLDVPETLVRDIDAVRQRIGVDRGALIKVWLHERVAKEKAE